MVLFNERDNKMSNPKALEQLLKRVSSTYTFPENLNKKKADLTKCFLSISDVIYEKYLNTLITVLEKTKPEQIFCIANRGLLLGAMACDARYDVKTMEVHRGLYWHWHSRNKEIIQYYIRPNVINGIRYYNALDAATISRTASEPSIQVSVLEIDEIEPGKRTVILDDCVDLAFVMPVASKFVSDRNSLVVKNVVFDNYPHLPNVISLNELIKPTLET